MEKEPDICCYEFTDFEKWDEKSHVWENKKFIKDNVKQIFHIPLNMGKVITNMLEKIEKAGAEVAGKETLRLSYDPSPWKSELYISVSKEVLDANNVTLSGNFITKVFDGAYNEVPNWIKEMSMYLNSIGKKAKKYYLHYCYCPKCAKKYGHNYSIIFAEVE